MKKILILLCMLFLFSSCSSSREEVVNDEPVIPNEIVEKTKEEEILDKMSLEEKVGQLFLVRYESIEDEDLNTYKLGGITFYARDVKNLDPDSLKEKIDNLQSFSNVAMFMSVDEEGGTVTRISRFPQYREYNFRSPRSYYAQGGLDLVLQREEEKTKLLNNLGLNLNMAPVADVSDVPGAFMYDRSLGQSSEICGEFVTKTSEISISNHVGSVIKHFPGHGNNSDTHTSVPIDNRTLSELKEKDFIPFQMAMDDKNCAVMIGHTIVTCLDDNYPASLSKKVIDYIRNEMHFDGVVMPDALDMEICKLYGDEKCAILAINAGCDMLCTTDYKEQFSAIIDAVKSNEVSMDRIDEAVLRILRWKLKIGIIE